MARRTAFKRTNDVRPPEGRVRIPYRFAHRSYQAPLLAAMMPIPPTYRPIKERGCCVWHRGSGKDLTALSGVIIPHMLFNPGTYWHVFPKFAQGKKAIWQPQDDGKLYTNQFPPHLVTRKNDTECLIEMESNIPDEVTSKPKLSVYQIVGGDTLSENLVGAGPRGVVFSEWPVMDKSAYDFIAPRLRQSKGWALFIYTFRGKNHGWDIFQVARDNPNEWFCDLRTVLDTRKDAPGEDGGYVITPEDIEKERREGRAEPLIQQEYFCSPDGFALASIYGDCLAQARTDKRVTRIPREANYPVGCCLDIGRSDGTAIWFYQTLNREIRLIDYLAFRANKIQDQSAAEYAIRRIREKPYMVTRIVLPNDAQVKGYSASKSTYDIFADAFPDTVLMDKIPVQAGIEMVRGCFSRIVIDEAKCSIEQEDKLPSGIDSLAQYHRAWDDDKADYSGEPIHDQFSHGADALRYGAMEGFTPPEMATEHSQEPPRVEMDFDPRQLLGGPMPRRGW